MPAWLPRSTCGVVFVVLYLAIALIVVNDDRKNRGGGWISLNGMPSYLITFPVSALGEFLGVKPDYKRNLDMSFAILVCAGLVYLVGAGLGALGKLLFTAGGKG